MNGQIQRHLPGARFDDAPFDRYDLTRRRVAIDSADLLSDADTADFEDSTTTDSETIVLATTHRYER
ncbi:hypothetical protein [Natronorubrum halophilum]|uniref:hypothetical protein n=1 Tax=Natronorubrum halophilum TaxID=1702106 RepID=UPI0010C1EC65|nr:hypothetical protein [Natronorubrum halophilum]